MHKFIHQIEEKRQAIFVGFFGPIGVSAIFYLYLSLEFLETITVDGVMREDAEQLSEVFMIVVWFLAICSIVSPLSCRLDPELIEQVVHGLSIPLGKLGFFLPRTLSRAFTGSQGRDSSSGDSFPVGDRIRASTIGVLRQRSRRTSGQSTPTQLGSGVTSKHPIYRIGGTVIREGSGARTPVQSADSGVPGTPPAIAHERTIRFPDEEPPWPSLDES
jgi:hypothetical protein